MKPQQLMSEEAELAIFSRLQAGESIAQIAREMGCRTWTVYRLRQLGRPRWRHKAHGELHPSSALIAWHCHQLQASWTALQEFQRRVQTSEVLGVPGLPEDVLELPVRESLWNLQEESS